MLISDKGGRIMGAEGREKVDQAIKKASPQISSTVAEAVSGKSLKQKHNQKAIKIVVVRHEQGYTAYPLDGQIEGAVVGQGDTYEAALNSLISAINSHIEYFGPSVLESDFPILEAAIEEYLIPAKTIPHAEISR